MVCCMPDLPVKPAGEPELKIPPDLKGYHGLRYVNSATGQFKHPECAKSRLVNATRRSCDTLLMYASAGGIIEVELNRFLKAKTYFNTRYSYVLWHNGLRVEPPGPHMGACEPLSGPREQCCSSTQGHLV
jgi:hypothetical protein